MTAPASPNVAEQTPEDAAWQLRVTDGTVREFCSGLPKLGRPGKDAAHAAAGADPAGSRQHPPPDTLSSGGTGRPDDAGHAKGYYIYMGYNGTPIPAYRSQLGALALCLSGAATAWGTPKPGSWVSNLTRGGRHVGTPWVDRVWNAFHNGGDGVRNPRMNFARVDVVLELTRHYWNNTHPDTKETLPDMDAFLEELEALVTLVSHLQLKTEALK